MQEKILGWLFKGYRARLERDYQLYQETLKAGLDIKDVIRERLRGVRPGHPEEDRLQNKLASMETGERLAFLSKAQDVVSNETVKEVILYLITETEHRAILHAEPSEVNAHRMTINGLMLFEEQMASLSSMYQEEKKITEKMTETERHSAV